MQVNKSAFFAAALFIFFGVFSSALEAQSNTDIIRDILEEKIKNPSSIIYNKDDNYVSNRSNTEYKVSENTVWDEAEPFIIVNPEDSAHLLISYIDISGGSVNFPVYYSFDAGVTWELSELRTAEIFQAEPFTTYNIAGGGDPVFAFDHEGNIFFSWINLGIDFTTLDSRFVSFWAKSEDGGISWNLSDGTKKYIESGSLNLQTQQVGDFGSGIFDRPWFDIDRSGGPFNGTLYASGYFVPSVNTVNDTTLEQASGMIIKRKLVGVDSFEVVRAQVSEGNLAQYGNVKVDNKGNVHVTFGNLITNLARHSVSTDGGLTFSAPITVGTFSPGQQGQPVVNDRENPAVNMAIDYSNNNVYTVWNSVDNQLNGFFTYSHDEGQTWAEQQSISALADIANGQVFMPNIASNDNNEVSISWYALDADDKGDYMIINSIDGGLTWDEPIRLSNSPTDFTNYVVAGQGQAPLFGDYYTSAKAGCKTFSVWSDGRETNGPKIYVSTTDFCSDLTSISEFTPITEKIKLKTIYPNPTSESFSLALNLKEDTEIKVEVYDNTGKLAKAFSERSISIGETFETYNIADLPSANYFVVIDSSLGKISRKIIKP